MNMKMIIFLTLSLLLTCNLFPQDAHYWNIQYGTRSTLLGGAVIGSVSDLSATYYNPGAVALFKDANFILSARVYQIETITVEDGAGLGKDLQYSTIVPSPSFVAFDFKFDFLGDARLALSILTRQKMDFEFQTRLIDSLEIIETSPGKENFAGGISLRREFNEVWGGITYSTKLNDVAETNAIKLDLKENSKKVMVSSTKSMTGHCLGAAGAIEIAACALAIKNKIVPPTINLDNPDPECDLDYITHFSRKHKVKFAISNSIGFCGLNVAITLKKI